MRRGTFGIMGKDKQFLKDKYMLWMGIIFFLLALSFIFDLWGFKREVIQHPLVDPRYFTKEPVRQAKLEPVLIKDGYQYRCNDCHQTLAPSQIQKSFFSAHPEIELKHGVNNYCLTCHSLNNRESLRDINGNDVPFSQSQIACLQCHGTIYRAWERGVHGRINGYWDKTKGEIKKITCVQCHDPHQPKFKAMHPAPAPNVKNYQDSF